MKSAHCLFCSIITVFAVVGTACATEYHLTNTVFIQNWNISGNWSPNGVPNSPADAVIFSDSNDTSDMVRNVQIYGSRTVGVLRVESSTNNYLLNVDWAFMNDPLVLQSTGGNARLEVVALNNTKEGYNGNMRMNTGGGALLFASDTDVLVTNGSGTIAKMTTELALTGSGTINRYGNGLWLIDGSGPWEDYTGTVNLYSGETAINNDPTVFSNAMAVIVHRTSRLDLGQTPASDFTHTLPLVLDGGTLYVGPCNNRRLTHVTVTKDSLIDAAERTLILVGTLSGTGTVSQVGTGNLWFANCHVHPGFGTGILTIKSEGSSTDGTLLFGTNTAPVTLHIEVNNGGVAGTNYDQVVLTNLAAGEDVNLTNVNVVFSGAGSENATNWFLVTDRMLGGSTLNDVSSSPGLLSTIVYDYPNKRVGAVVVVPEPALLGGLAILAILGYRKHTAI